MKKFILQVISIVIISIGLVLIVKAWTEPSQAPPGANAPAPLNVGSASQTKTGNLTLANGLIVSGGNVGIGTTGPGAKLHVAGEAYFTYSGGEARIRDGSGFQIWNPEGTGNEVRLGAAWNKPGIYSNGDMFIGSESRIVINDNNQENFVFDAQYFSGRGKQILDVGDSWLRLNQAGQFSSGVYTPGTIRADGDIRAPIFYDQNNTGYYFDPDGTSNVNRMQVNYSPTASNDAATKGYVDAQVGAAGGGGLEIWPALPAGSSQSNTYYGAGTAQWEWAAVNCRNHGPGWRLPSIEEAFAFVYGDGGDGPLFWTASPKDFNEWEGGHFLLARLEWCCGPTWFVQQAHWLAEYNYFCVK